MRDRSTAAQAFYLREYLLLAGILFTFLWRFVAMLWIPALAPLEDYLHMLWAGLAAGLACQGRSWRHKSMLLLWTGLGLIFVRCLFGGEETLAAGLKSVAHGVLAFGVCYQAAIGLRKEALLTLLRLLLGIWTTVMTLLALAGVWAALYDQVLSTPQGGVYVIGVQLGRLNLLTYCTNSASNLAVSILAGLTGMLLTRNRLGRGLYALACLIMFLVLSLTVTRTAFLTLGFSLGLFLCCPLLSLLRRCKRLPRWLKAFHCLALTLAVTLGVYLGLNGALNLFNAAKVELRAEAETVEAIETIVPAPIDAAEDVPPETGDAVPEDASTQEVTTLKQRPIQLDDSILTGRQYVWQAPFRLLGTQPQYLLWGTSVVQPMQYVSPLLTVDFHYDHVHSLYLQVLVECGILGFALLALFLWRFLRSAWRLMVDCGRPMWMRTLPILPICALVAETVECLTLLTYDYPVLPFMMLFMGLTIRFAEDPRDFLRRKERA